MSNIILITSYEKGVQTHSRKPPQASVRNLEEQLQAEQTKRQGRQQLSESVDTRHVSGGKI